MNLTSRWHEKQTEQANSYSLLVISGTNFIVDLNVVENELVKRDGIINCLCNRNASQEA